MVCSLAGLLAARVCHNHFKRVVVIEPEPWLATEDSRILQAWTQRHDRSRIVQYHSGHGIYQKCNRAASKCFIQSFFLSSASYESQGLPGAVPRFWRRSKSIRNQVSGVLDAWPVIQSVLELRQLILKYALRAIFRGLPTMSIPMASQRRVSRADKA